MDSLYIMSANINQATNVLYNVSTFNTEQHI